jgi:hypothetical protein
MRNARKWFNGFQPESVEDIRSVYRGEHSAYYRMVTSYWDMACSFVTNGAIDEQMFNDSTVEHLAVFAKVRPFLDELRAVSGMPNYLRRLEQIVLRVPNAEDVMAQMLLLTRAIATAGPQEK